MLPIKKPGAKGGDRSLINEDIRISSVRLVGAAGEQIGIVTRDEALAEARKAQMDLVLIAPDAEPPVCKVMDYGKHLFELKKQKSAQRKKQKQIQVKEMKFRPGTEEADYQVKLRNLIRFLGDGDKAKVSLRFRGREMVHPEIGMQLMKRDRSRPRGARHCGSTSPLRRTASDDGAGSQEKEEVARLLLERYVQLRGPPISSMRSIL